MKTFVLKFSNCLKVATVVAVSWSMGIAKAQTTVDWTGIDAQLMPSTGSVNLANGSLVRMGTFNLSGPFNFGLIGSPGYSTFAEVDAFFQELSSTTTTVISGQSGAFEQYDFEISSPSVDPGDPLYVWAFNSATAANGTEWAIVGGTAGSQWSVPDTFPGSHAFDLGFERVIHFGSDSGIESPISATDATNVRLAAIPEPSTWLLIGLGCAFGLFRLRHIRRRL